MTKVKQNTNYWNIVRFFVTSFILMFIASVFTASPLYSYNFTPYDAAKPLENGIIIDRVICQVDPAESYTLYLPSNYSDDKEWPIIYAHDAWARGHKVVDLYRPLAEKYGFIVVCSNDSRNGPTAPIRRAIAAVSDDTHRRFPIDDKRVYATGFSGGARVSSYFHLLTNKGCAGIIAVGAGLSLEIKDPAALKGCHWYGLVGLADYNFRELMILDKKMEEAGVNHFVDIIEGGHEWPELPAIERAVEWMIINGMKDGTWPKKEMMVEISYQKALGYGRELEEKERAYFASRVYHCYHDLFEGLVDVTVAEAWDRKMKSAKEYKEYLEGYQERLQKEKVIFKRFGKVIYYIENPAQGNKSIDLPEALNQLSLDDLLKDRKKRNVYDRSFAQRVIYDLGIKSSRKGYYYLKKGDYDKARLFLEIATRTGPVPFEEENYYNLACVYSEFHQKEKALDNLEQAIKKGYKNKEKLEHDHHLDFIRNEKKLRKLLDGKG